MQLTNIQKKNKNIYILKYVDWVNKIVAGSLLRPAYQCTGWSRRKCLQQSLLCMGRCPWAVPPTVLPGRSGASPGQDDGCPLMLRRRWWPRCTQQIPSFSASWSKSFPHCMPTPCTATGTTFHFSSRPKCQMDPDCGYSIVPFTILHNWFYGANLPSQIII